MTDTCPVHARNDAKDPIEDNVPARAVTYLGEYAVATLDNPEFASPMAMLAGLFGKPAPKMFMHLVVKVGETGCLGDVLDAEGLKAATVFRDVFLEAGDERLEPFVAEAQMGNSAPYNEALTKIFHDSHDLVVDSVRNKVIG
jgi:hypothetical protein